MLFFWGGVFFLWVPIWACFGAPGGSKKGFLFFLGFFLGGLVLVVGPFWACFGVPGSSKKGFLLFFWGFFCVVAGVHVPRFCFSFLSPLFLGHVFLLFLEVFCSFFALGAGRRAVLFSPSSFGACFCLFFFWGGFRCFFFSKGLVLVVGPFWACFGAPGGSKKGFLLFFFGAFFFGGGVFFLWVPFWACFGAPGGSKKGFLLFFLGLFFWGACSCCGSFVLGLFWGPGGL